MRESYAWCEQHAADHNLTGVHADGRTYLCGYVFELGTHTLYVADPDDTERELGTVRPGWTVQIDSEDGTPLEIRDGLTEEQARRLVRRATLELTTACAECGAEIGEPCRPFCTAEED